MKHHGLYSDKYRGQIEDSKEWVEGYLTILPLRFEHIKVGHYISNQSGAPFAYKVNRQTVELMEMEEEEE